MMNEIASKLGWGLILAVGLYFIIVILSWVAGIFESLWKARVAFSKGEELQDQVWQLEDRLKSMREVSDARWNIVTQMNSDLTKMIARVLPDMLK